MAYRILIVDDSPVMRAFLREFMERLGHAVAAEAETGADAIKAYAEHKPDVVTLDLSLPDMDGFAVLQEIRRINPAVPVIMLTGNTQTTILSQAKALNILAVLSKPFTLEGISSALAKIEPPSKAASS